MLPTVSSRLRVLAALGLVAGACSCDPETSESTLTIVTPADGATLNVADDVLPDVEGLQIEVIVEALKLDGRTVRLEGTAGTASEARVVGTTARLTLTVKGAGTLQAVAVDEAGIEVRSGAISLAVDDAASACRVVSPAHGSVLGTADDRSPSPGFQYAVQVRCAGVELGNPVTLSLNGDTWSQAPLGAGGLALFPSVELVEGENEVRAEIGTDAGETISDTSLVTVDTGKCRVVMSPATGTVFNARGENGAVADLLAGEPMDALLTVETGCTEGEIEIRRGSVPVARAAVGGQVEMPVQLADGAAELRAFVLAGGQERGVSPSVRYTVDAVVPTATLTFPTAGLSFNDGSDRSEEPGLQISVRGQFAGIPASSPFEIVLTTDEGVPQILDGVVGTSGTFDVLVTLPDGAHELFVRARRQSGTTAESPAVKFSSRYFDARFYIAQPADGESLPLARDADPATPGFQAAFTLAGDNLAGRSGTLNCSGQSAAFTLDDDSTAVVPVTFNVNACAGRQVTCTARLDADGVTFETPAVALLVDPTPPVVNLLTPQDGETLGSSLLSIAATTGCPGEAQTVTVLNGGDVVHGPEAVVDNALLAGPLTLPAGESLLTLSVADAAGNVTDVPFRIFVDADVPTVSFLSPEPADPVVLGVADDVDADLTNGLQYAVAVEVPNELVGTLVELTVANRAPLSTRTATDGQGRRVATFDAVSLPEGAFELRACATDEAGGVGCATVQVEVDTGRPVCDVTLPADGKSLGMRDDRDDDAAGVQTEVSVDTSAENGTFVTLRIQDPLGAESTTSAGVADGLARFTGISFSAEGTYVVSAVCRTQSGVEGRSLPNRIGVDFTAPSVEIVEPADGAVLNAQAPDRGAAEGFQVDVKVRSDEAAFGAIAFLTVHCGQGPVTPPPAQVNSLQEATFRAVTLPSVGVCTLSVVLEDAAGNRSEPVTSTVTVDREAPVVTIQDPVDGSIFGAKHDAIQATPGFDLARLRALVAGASAAHGVTLSVGDEVVGAGALTPEGQSLRAEWLLVPLAEGLNDVVVEAVDDAGNVGTGRIAVTVNTLAPVISITNVRDDATLRGRHDIDPARPGLQFSVQLGGERLASGTTVRLCSPQAPAEAADCEGAGDGRVLASNVLSGGNAIISGATIPEGRIELYAVAIDVAENVAESPVLSVYVDSYAPVVEQFTMEKHDGTLLASPGGTGVLLGPAADSVAATPGMQVRLRVKISDGLAAPSGAVFFMDSHPVPNTQLGPPVFVDANGEASLDVTLSDGGHRLHVVAIDTPGNSSPTPDTPGASPVLLHVGVDLTPPAVSILAPLPGSLLAAQDADPSAEGLQYDVEIDSDAGAGREVSLLLDGAPFATVTLPPTGTRASTRVVLPEGNHTLSAQASDAAGNVGTTPPSALLIDSIAPIIAIEQPSDGQTLSTDADPVADGFQSEVQVRYSQVEDGRTVRLFSSTGGLLATATTSAAGLAMFPPLTLPGGAQQLTARVSDVSGNVTTSAPVTVTVDTGGPSVWFASSQNPLWFGASTDGGDGQCHVLVEGHTDAAGATVALLEDGNVKATATASGTTVTFADVVIDPGQAVQLQLRATDALDRVGYSPARQAKCDLTAPSVTLVEPATPIVKYVAYGNPGNVADAVADLLPTSALEANFTVSVTDAVDAFIELSSDVDGVLASRTLTADGQVSFPSVRVPSPGAHVLTVKVTDPAGNVSQASWQATVDVLAPGAANPQLEVVDLRNGKVRLVFPAPGSDGASGAPVAGYVVRRASGAIVDATGWAGATAVTPTDLVVAAPGETQAIDVENLVPGRVHHFAVRAFDAAGNLGPLGTSPAAELLMNRRTVEVWAGDAAPTTLVNSQFLVTDLDGDGFDDMISSNWTMNTNVGEVQIIYGGPTLSAPVKLEPADAQRFGALAVGDVNGDGFTDLLVGAQFTNTGLTLGGDGQPDTTSRDGAVYVYLGAANSRLASGAAADTVLQGEIPEGSLPLQPLFGFGFSVEVVDDLTGDGIDDVVVGAPGLFNRAGRVYVIAGRETWPATLAAIPNAHAVLSTNVTATAGPWFGHQLASLGDVDGDGRGDFAVALPGGGLSEVEGKVPYRPVYLVSGALAAGEVAVESIAHAVYPEAPGDSYPASNQFGARLVVGELTGDESPDLAVLDGVLNQYFIYDGASLSVPASAGGAPADLTSARLIKSLIPSNLGTGTSGLSLWKDVNGDGIDELSAGFTGGSMAAWCFYGRSATEWRNSFGGAASGTLPGSIVILGTVGSEGANFGVRSGSGHIVSTEGRRDIAVFALGGKVTVLSDP